MTQPRSFDRSRDPLPPDNELWGDATSTSAPTEMTTDATMDATTDATVDDTIAALSRRAYHEPGAPPRDAMWAAIQARRAPVQPQREPSLVQVHRGGAPWWQHWRPIAALAATLAVGVAIGRSMDSLPGALTTVPAPAIADGSGRAAPDGLNNALPQMLAQLTSEHLVQTEALLVTASLAPLSANGGSETLVAMWAQELLTSTRLLLDTEALRDPRTRRLLLDLELTLALILQAQTSGRTMELQAVREALTSGDLLLRVRSAASPTPNSPDRSTEASE